MGNLLINKTPDIFSVSHWEIIGDDNSLIVISGRVAVAKVSGRMMIWAAYTKPDFRPGTAELAIIEQSGEYHIDNLIECLPGSRISLYVDGCESNIFKTDLKVK